MRLLAHPFRLADGGAVATVEDDTEDAAAQETAILILTRKGERTLVPDYGVTDPAFSTLNLAEVAVGILDYGPEGLEVLDLDVTHPTDTLERVELTIALPEE